MNNPGYASTIFTSVNENNKHRVSPTENEVNKLILIQKSTKTNTIYTL